MRRRSRARGSLRRTACIQPRAVPDALHANRLTAHAAPRCDTGIGCPVLQHAVLCCNMKQCPRTPAARGDPESGRSHPDPRTQNASRGQVAEYVIHTRTCDAAHDAVCSLRRSRRRGRPRRRGGPFGASMLRRPTPTGRRRSRPRRTTEPHSGQAWVTQVRARIARVARTPKSLLHATARSRSVHGPEARYSVSE